MEKFLTCLRSPTSLNNPNTDSILGCSLSFVANSVKEHYQDTIHRSNNLSVMLIGRQAILLARYGYRLVDCLQTNNESEPEKYKRQALGKIVQCL